MESQVKKFSLKEDIGQELSIMWNQRRIFVFLLKIQFISKLF